jgi:hypothetical protein
MNCIFLFALATCRHRRIRGGFSAGCKAPAERFLVSAARITLHTNCRSHRLEIKVKRLRTSSTNSITRSGGISGAAGREPDHRINSGSGNRTTHVSCPRRSSTECSRHGLRVRPNVSAPKRGNQHRGRRILLTFQLAHPLFMRLLQKSGIESSVEGPSNTHTPSSLRSAACGRTGRGVMCSPSFSSSSLLPAISLILSRTCFGSTTRPARPPVIFILLMVNSVGNGR